MGTLKITYDNKLCITVFGVVEAKPDVHFHILVTNIGSTSKLLISKQKIDKASTFPTTLIESQITYAEFLGFMFE